MRLQLDPNHWSEAQDSIHYLLATMEGYEEERHKYVLARRAGRPLPEVHEAYQNSLEQFKAAHNQWKSIMSQLIQSRQL